MRDRLLSFGLIAAVALGVTFAYGAPKGVITNSVELCDPNAPTHCAAPDASGNIPVSGSFSLGGFSPATAGTPITATTGGVAGTLPAGTVVVATNVGTTNAAYCALGAASTTANQYIAPNGGWFAFTVGSATQLTCATSTSTTTVNMVGGAGLPTGTGGGSGGGGSGGAVTIVDGGDVAQGTTTDAACATDNGNCTAIQLDKRTNQRLTTINTTLGSPFQAGGSIGNTTFAATQSGTWNVTNISGTISLPTGASTAAKQPAIGTAGTASTDVLTVQGIASMTPFLATLSAETTKVIGTVNQGTSPWVVSLPTGASTAANQATEIASLATIATNTGAAIPAGTAIIGKVGVDQTTPGTTNGVAIVGVNAATALAGNGATGTGSQRLTVANDNTGIANWGHGASGATAPTGATLGGCKAQSAEATAVSTGQQIGQACDLVGKQIMLPYANPENFVSGSTSAMTGTTSTSVIASAGGSLRNYVTACTFSNSHATVGTMILLQDGSGGTTLWQAPAAAVFGGAHVVFPTPLKTTAATALFTANVTTGANTFVSCTGYKGI